MLAWCSVMLATYKENYRSFFQKCSLSISRIRFICVPYYDGSY